MVHRKERIRAHYEPRISPHRPNHEVVDWASHQRQQIRFQVLLDHVDLREKSLLDVGCGLGDLYAFLKDRGMPVSYTGVDLLPRMAQAARERHPDGQFDCADIFADDPYGRDAFDVVFCSGALNLNLGNNLAFLPVAVRRFLELSRQYVVFNLLHRRARCQDDRYFDHDPKKVLNILKPLPCRSRLIDDYLDNDFTVICRKTV
jgi:SAM-dependent methyltransferase